MSHPPPPPPGPPPGYGPPPHGGPSYDGRGRRNTGLVAALVILSVALVCALGVGTFLLVSSSLDDDRAAGGATSSAPATGSTGPTGSTGSTEESSTTTAPPSAYAPSDDTGDDVVGDVEASDFPGDWDFRYGDVRHRASLTRSVDHGSCGPVESRSVLTQQRCEYAVQWTYTAHQGKVRITHVFLVFDTEPHAKAAGDDIDDADLDLPPGSTLPGHRVGRWTASSYGNVVGITIGTAVEGVRPGKLTSMVNYLNTDYRVALTFQL